MYVSVSVSSSIVGGCEIDYWIAFGVWSSAGGVVGSLSTMPSSKAPFKCLLFWHRVKFVNVSLFGLSHFWHLLFKKVRQSVAEKKVRNTLSDFFTQQVSETRPVCLRNMWCFRTFFWLLFAVFSLFFFDFVVVVFFVFFLLLLFLFLFLFVVPSGQRAYSYTHTHTPTTFSNLKKNENVVFFLYFFFFFFFFFLWKCFFFLITWKVFVAAVLVYFTFFIQKNKTYAVLISGMSSFWSLSASS